MLLVEHLGSLLSPLTSDYMCLSTAWGQYFDHYVRIVCGYSSDHNVCGCGRHVVIRALSPLTLWRSR